LHYAHHSAQYHLINRSVQFPASRCGSAAAAAAAVGHDAPPALLREAPFGANSSRLPRPTTAANKPVIEPVSRLNRCHRKFTSLESKTATVPFGKTYNRSSRVERLSVARFD
jgi:hypothetical protein